MKYNPFYKAGYSKQDNINWELKLKMGHLFKNESCWGK